MLNVLGWGGRDEIGSGSSGGGKDVDGDKGRACEILDIMPYLGGSGSKTNEKGLP